MIGAGLAPIVRGMDALLSELCGLALRHASGPRTETPVARVAISTGNVATGPLPGLYEPMVCMVLQGAKQVMIGDQVLRYDQASYFIPSLDLPAIG